MHRLARILALLLAVALSGAAPLVTELLEQPACANGDEHSASEDCEDCSDGDCSDCPSTCAQCACCHAAVTMSDRGRLPSAMIDERDLVTTASGRELDGAARGVFLPPRS